MSYSAHELYDVYSETTRKARKAHICAACKRAIRPGDRYAHVVTVFDGTAKTIKRCGACQETHLHLRELCYDCEMWPDEKLGCGLRYESEWGDLPDDIAALAFLTDDEAGRLLGRDTP